MPETLEEVMNHAEKKTIPLVRPPVESYAGVDIVEHLKTLIRKRYEVAGLPVTGKLTPSQKRKRLDLALDVINGMAMGMQWVADNYPPDCTEEISNLRNNIGTISAIGFFTATGRDPISD